MTTTILQLSLSDCEFERWTAHASSLGLSLSDFVSQIVSSSVENMSGEDTIALRQKADEIERKAAILTNQLRSLSASALFSWTPGPIRILRTDNATKLCGRPHAASNKSTIDAGRLVKSWPNLPVNLIADKLAYTYVKTG